MADKITFSPLPEHIGIIMDGNGRWAKQRGLERSQGHKAGAEAFRKICEYAADIGISNITFYAFSTENWKRPPQEVAAIMNLLRDYLREGLERKNENEQKKWRMKFIGDMSALPQDIVKLVESMERQSADKTKTVVNLAVNYGGKDEILHSVKKIAERVKLGELDPDDIAESDVESGLYTAGQPDPDIIIRPSGEYRLSNFLIWQAAYSELWFSDVLWPDFTTDDFDRVLKDYSERNRRFGGI